MQIQREATQRILDTAANAIAARGIFRIVLAGGNTPRLTYAALCNADTDWTHWEIFFSDERCVPVTDADRNSYMAAELWLDHVAIPRRRIHAIPAERGADAGARAYIETLHDIDDFDFVLLGLGEDGHTASLFPDHDWGMGMDAPDALAICDAPKPPPQRVSLSAARLSQSRAILFLVTDDSKRDAITHWHAGDNIPACAIRPPVGVDVLFESKLLSAPAA